MKTLFRMMMTLALVAMVGLSPAALAETPNESPSNPAAAQQEAPAPEATPEAPMVQPAGGSCAAQAAFTEAAFLAPGPTLGGNCPSGTCQYDNDCGFYCSVPNCPFPCGACVWEVPGGTCSGVCVCR